MKLERLLDDVNLFEIVFPEASSSVVLNFLNMSDGARVGSLICSGVIAFSYHATPDDGLPQYVGEVNHALIAPDEESALLERLRYEFVIPEGQTLIPDAGEMHYAHLEGGIVIRILCTGVQLLLEGVMDGSNSDDA